MNFWYIFLPIITTAFPRFDPTAQMRGVRVPADAGVDTVIYRLRATDSAFDFPLTFSIIEKLPDVSVVTLNCSRLNSLCQANVVVKRRLSVGTTYSFVVEARNIRGASVRMDCSFVATNATTPLAEVFPGAPTLLRVSEGARRNTELGTVLARGSKLKPRAVVVELWGSSVFGLRQKVVNERDAETTVLLLGKLDYETKTVHHLTIYANDPFTQLEDDTRNIAGWPLLVAVLDEQDTPPVFTEAPPTTLLESSLRQGDVVLQVRAEDGDRGKPRRIRYGLEESNKYSTYFNISEDTGEIRLSSPLASLLTLTHTSPFLLTVVAEEIREDPSEPPPQSTTVNLALIPPGFKGGQPHFGLPEYSTRLPENSPPGTALRLDFPEIVTQPGDVVTLELVNNNGTFEVTPGVIEGRGRFEVKVRDPGWLDYEERRSVECGIAAKEIGSGNYSSVVKLVVLLEDVNDNAPEFVKEEYFGSIPENSPEGTSVVLLEARDVDSGAYGKIKYTRLIGQSSASFHIHPTSGLITVSGPLDAELNQHLEFLAEAADEDGIGLTSTVKVTINLIDLNDNAPKFERSIYEFIVHPERRKFSSNAYVKAVDADVTSPNNFVRYELAGRAENLTVDGESGEIRVVGRWNGREMVVLKVVGVDGGAPPLWSETEVRVYPPEGGEQTVIFLVSGRDPDPDYLASKLRKITGADIRIEEVRPYEDGKKSVVVATIRNSKDTIIDVKRIQQQLDKDYQNHDDLTTRAETTQEAGNLWWILLVLILLLLLLAACLVFCCVCPRCPLYVPPKRRQIGSAEEVSRKIIVGGSGHQELQSKSVQVAEWFGRREAWTPEKVEVQRERVQRIQRQPNITQEPERDQYYIREGNADILRLVTRGDPQPQRAESDSGKELLMRRFIEQQQAQSFLPNVISKLQTEHELLETSLRQQNALLRQMMVERERDLRLETQSLPAGTQTDVNAATQTEFKYLRPVKRRVRSDNDASDLSDEDEDRSKKRKSRRVKVNGRRKITTPIMEESESNVDSLEKLQKSSSTQSSTVNGVRDTRTTILRQQMLKGEDMGRSKSRLRKEVLREISDSLGEDEKTWMSEDSLEEDFTRQNKRYHSESDLRFTSSKSQSRESAKSLSQSDLGVVKKKKKRVSRYMDWYNKKKDKQAQEKEKQEKQEKIIVGVSKRLLADTESSARKKVEKKTATGPEHPLLQHSERRFETLIPNNKNLEEDVDSGIALTKPSITQKKSVFTIAYNDMHTSQLRPESSTP